MIRPRSLSKNPAGKYMSDESQRLISTGKMGVVRD